MGEESGAGCLTKTGIVGLIMFSEARSIIGTDLLISCAHESERRKTCC
jgi:hypothetical protein